MRRGEKDQGKWSGTRIRIAQNHVARKKLEIGLLRRFEKRGGDRKKYDKKKNEFTGRKSGPRYAEKLQEEGLKDKKKQEIA